MKPLLSALVAAAVLASAAGCAKSDASGKHRTAASHAHHMRITSSSAAPAAVPTPTPTVYPTDAGASNAALGRNARDAMGHPAISDY